MKVIINMSNLVIDSKNLKHLDALLADAVGSQDYDYNNGDYLYYIRPMAVGGISATMLTDEVCAAQQLVWKLKQEDKK